MSYDTWKCSPPDEELETEACGHTIGTCVCDEAPAEEDGGIVAEEKMTLTELTRFEADVNALPERDERRGLLTLVPFFVRDAKRLLTLARKALEQEAEDIRESELWGKVNALAKKALADREQEAKPVPTGVVTREHREAVLAAYAGSLDNALLHEARWLETGVYERNNTGRLDRVAQALAIHEQAAYERGKADRERGIERRIRDVVEAWERWKRGDLMEEEFDGTIAELAYQARERLVRP